MAIELNETIESASSILNAAGVLRFGATNIAFYVSRDDKALNSASRARRDHNPEADRARAFAKAILAIRALQAAIEPVFHEQKLTQKVKEEVEDADSYPDFSSKSKKSTIIFGPSPPTEEKAQEL